MRRQFDDEQDTNKLLSKGYQKGTKVSKIKQRNHHILSDPKFQKFHVCVQDHDKSFQNNFDERKFCRISLSLIFAPF